MAQYKDKNRSVENIIQLSAQSIANMIDVSTVIGQPIISQSGTQIIPFTKVTIGYLSGSGEFDETKVIRSDENTLAGGAGSVVSMRPFGFLIDDGKTCRLIKVPNEPIEQLLQKTEEIIAKYVPKKA